MAATQNAGFTLTPANGDAEVIQGMNVTSTFLPTLRVTPALGRNFTAEEDRPGGNRQVVVMSDGLWKRAFGSDPGVIGRTKQSYDLWGETVNLASRMESHGLPGRVQVAERTRELIGDAFEVESRGAIDLKGIGPKAAFVIVAR